MLVFFPNYTLFRMSARNILLSYISSVMHFKFRHSIWAFLYVRNRSKSVLLCVQTTPRYNCSNDGTRLMFTPFQDLSTLAILCAVA